MDTTPKDERRELILHIIQPGLEGLMDGSVSSLAPLFATAFATKNNHTTFLVGIAVAVGAGISMAFSEALSDDGKLRTWEPHYPGVCLRPDDFCRRGRSRAAIPAILLPCS